MRWLSLVVVWACATPKPPASESARSACAPMLPLLLERTEKRLFQFLPAAEKYEAAARSIRNEMRVRPYLDERVGANPGGEAAYLVECHANVCRIEVNTRVANKNWNAAVQLNRDASLVDRWRPEPWGGYLWLFDPDGEKPPTSSVRDCAQLEARLATAEERLDAVRPLRERFIELRPSTDRERIVSMRLMEAMDTASFQLECRGSICRVQTKTMRVHRIEQKKLFSRVELEKSGFESVVFVEMREDVVARGEAFMAALTAALVKQATRVAECRQKHWRRGMVVFDLLVERGMRVLLHDSGENAHSPLAKCLRTIVEESLPSVDGPIQLPGRPIRFWSH